LAKELYQEQFAEMDGWLVATVVLLPTTVRI
jgi:hypothetical protein